jgi:HAD superfamily hydrolase (TIGR01509 family)
MNGNDRDARLAVVFDLDGTLVDSNYLHTLAWARALRSSDEPVSMHAIHRLIGMGADQLLPRLIGREDDSIAKRRDDEYARLLDDVVVFPGATRLLRAVRELGMLVVLATSSAPSEYGQMIELLDAGDIIDAHTTIDDVSKSKPDPEIFHAALNIAGVDHRHAIVVGDSVWDVHAATAAGMGCIGVESGGSSREELFAAGALQVFRDVAQLGDLLHVSAIATLAGAR